MQDTILPQVIFSPGDLAINLANGLVAQGAKVRLYSPGHVTTDAENVTADLGGFETELALRGDSYLDLLRKHPLTFVSLARQVQAELVSQAFADANAGLLDVVHIYTNEEDVALPFAQFCTKPVVFTHHDPFSLLARYRNVFPKYKALPWISISNAQRADMPADTNWVGTVYHGLPARALRYCEQTDAKNGGPYAAFLGRVIESKGVHLAIAAIQQYNARQRQSGLPILPLRIAGRHYAGHSKDAYWQDKVLPHIDDVEIFYDGPVKSMAEKQKFLGGARVTIMPSTFDEPFGMVAIESMACGTPVIGLDSGAIKEVVGDVGIVVPRSYLAQEPNQLDEQLVTAGLATGIDEAKHINRHACRERFESNFTADRMCKGYIKAYEKLVSAGQHLVESQK